MVLQTTLRAFPFLVLAALPAHANPATPEGAARLTAAFQTYLGQTPGVVTVLPQGESYGVTLDFTPLITKGDAAKFSAEISPQQMVLTDQGDGLWGVTQDQPMTFQVSIPGQLDLKGRIAAIKSSGTFDEKLATFRQQSIDMTDMVMDQTMVTDGQVSTVNYTLASGHFETTATPSAVTGVDLVARYTIEKLYEKIVQPLGIDDTTMMDVTVTGSSISSETTATAMQIEGIYQLVAWAVAHPSPEAMQADQAGLKTLLGSAMPLWKNLNGTSTINTVEVATPMGRIGIDKLAVAIDMNGFVSDGRFSEGFTVAGLALPDALVPTWAKDLVPRDFAFEVALSRFDLAAPAALFIAAFDMAKPEPVDDAKGQEMLTALMPEGVVDIALSPGNVASPLYDLRYEGKMSAGPGGVPTGAASITLTGMDQVTAALQAAPDEVKTQAMPVLALVGGMARAADGGGLVWKIDGTTPGKLLVNGMDLAPMLAPAQ
ncbi:hypothetical protein [Rhodobacter ferrooxidans]|uniref:DUF2125 domain-containing protein n=1 Tax=Rhodobacter ferrooxidans TaxID=371731 RepID=C8RZU6_9RHOB|nr:hypothetical protein [Rhodobacter sp. SW2]EEW25893.1 conserved hypothetical protein [Rhodobacter sp. SW2]